MFSLQRNVVLACQRFKELSHGATLAPFSLFKASTDTPYAFQQFLILKKLLVSFGALNDHLRLTINCEHSGIAGLFKPGDVVAGIALEFTEGVNVGKVERHTVNLH